MMEMRPKLLCPSILNLAIDNIREEVEKLDATDMDIYHVDLMDGTFVPNFGMSVRCLLYTSTGEMGGDAGWLHLRSCSS